MRPSGVVGQDDRRPLHPRQDRQSPPQIHERFRHPDDRFPVPGSFHSTPLLQLGRCDPERHSPDPGGGVAHRATPPQRLRERLRNGVVRDLAASVRQEHGPPQAIGLLAVHALESFLGADRFRTVAFDVRLHDLIVHVDGTGGSGRRSLTGPRLQATPGRLPFHGTLRQGGTAMSQKGHAKKRDRHHPHRGRLRGFGYFRRLGPGFVTGAADDDPAGIGTYSQVGATFRFDLVWTAWLSLPLASAVQETAARLGLSTGRGLMSLIEERFPRWVMWTATALVVGANVFNIGADLGSMAEAFQLLVPIPFAVLVIGMAAVILGLEVFVSYDRYSIVLRWLALSILAYVVELFVVDVDWSAVLAGFIPTFTPSAASISAVAILGRRCSLPLPMASRRGGRGDRSEEDHARRNRSRRCGWTCSRG